MRLASTSFTYHSHIGQVHATQGDLQCLLALQIGVTRRNCLPDATTCGPTGTVVLVEIPSGISGNVNVTIHLIQGGLEE
jgi:hypothetical protein